VTAVQIVVLSHLRRVRAVHATSGVKTAMCCVEHTTIFTYTC
jgi:hypothetical protein